jgi:ankyrin repeat protein
VKWHLENGADPNIWTTRGYTALELAAYHHPLSIVKLLVDAGADLHTNTAALHGAAADSVKFGGVVHPGRYEIMDFLHIHGADINQLEPEANPSGDERYPRQVNCYTGTPLHRAVESENPETVRFLLRRGADRRVKGAMGLTPLEVAKYLRLYEIANILSEE